MGTTREVEILPKTHGEQGPVLEGLPSANCMCAKNLEAVDLRDENLKTLSRQRGIQEQSFD